MNTLRFRIIVYNPQTKREEDQGILEARSWEDAAAIVRTRYNYPRRMIPVAPNVIPFPRGQKD